MDDYEKIFKKGEKMVMNELNMYTLLETFMKIKATLSILVDQNGTSLAQI